MLWDAVTTFLGVITIIAGPTYTLSIQNTDPNTWGIYGISLVGAVVVFCFNLITVNVWEEAKEGRWTLIAPWFLCVVFDFFTSLAGNYRFILPERQGEIAVVGVIWFTTLLTTISPMTVRYIVMDYSDR